MGDKTLAKTFNTWEARNRADRYQMERETSLELATLSLEG